MSKNNILSSIGNKTLQLGVILNLKHILEYASMIH
jgi:hypothetical protein